MELEKYLELDMERLWLPLFQSHDEISTDSDLVFMEIQCNNMKLLLLVTYRVVV